MNCVTCGQAMPIVGEDRGDVLYHCKRCGTLVINDGEPPAVVRPELAAVAPKPLTRDGLLRAAGRIDFDEAEIASWLERAGADAHEGAEWLPYYKLALAMLNDACAELHATAALLARRASNDIALGIIDGAARVVFAALNVQGAGPMLDAAKIASAHAMTRLLAAEVTSTIERSEAMK